MNYLAHVLLPGPDDDLRLGGLIGDFMRGSNIGSFAPGVQRGIRLHRHIDRLTDAHPVFRRSRERVGDAMHRFSGVVTDVGYDHFLAASFETWTDGQSLTGFARSFYALLESRIDELPPGLRDALPWIIGQDWLTSYADFEHLDRAFAGMSRRVRRANPLLGAKQALERNYDALAGDFAEFFPDMLRSARAMR